MSINCPRIGLLWGFKRYPKNCRRIENLNLSACVWEVAQFPRLDVSDSKTKVISTPTGEESALFEA